MHRQSGNTTRQHIPSHPEQLVEQALRKASRFQLGVGASNREIANQTRLTVALLKDLRHQYVTFPQAVRVVLEDYLRG